MASSLGDKMLIEDINAMIEEHTESGSIQKGKWLGITDSQVVLLNASPVPLTYSMVVTLLQAHSDPFVVESPKVDSTQMTLPDSTNLPFNPMNQFPNQMRNDRISSLEAKVDNMSELISQLLATLQADQPPAEQ